MQFNEILSVTNFIPKLKNLSSKLIKKLCLFGRGIPTAAAIAPSCDGKKTNCQMILPPYLPLLSASLLLIKQTTMESIAIVTMTATSSNTTMQMAAGRKMLDLLSK